MPHYNPPDFLDNTDQRVLAEALDAWLVDNELCRDVTPPVTLEQIRQEDLTLVA
jgi:hypothetical protein